MTDKEAQHYVPNKYKDNLKQIVYLTILKINKFVYQSQSITELFDKTQENVFIYSLKHNCPI